MNARLGFLFGNASVLRKDCKGAASVEMAIIATSVVVLAPLLFDLASVTSSFMSLSGSLRAGVQLALMQPSNTSGITQTIQTASGFPADSVTVDTSQFCECNSNNVGCGTACGGTTPYKYMTIT